MIQIEQWGFFFPWWAMKSISYVCNFLSLEKSGQSVMSVLICWYWFIGGNEQLMQATKIARFQTRSYKSCRVCSFQPFEEFNNNARKEKKKFKNELWRLQNIIILSLHNRVHVLFLETGTKHAKKKKEKEKKRKEKVLLVGISSKTCVSCCGNRDLETLENWQVLSRDCRLE